MDQFFMVICIFHLTPFIFSTVTTSSSGKNSSKIYHFIRFRLLILCTGNGCRSQMAQGFLQSFDRSLKVSSAGTFPASKVNPRAIQVMAEIGIDISMNTTKSVDEFLNDQWDYVITVCDDAKEACLKNCIKMLKCT